MASALPPIRRRSSSRTSSDFQLFGASGRDEGTAPWFKPEQLTAPGFQPDAYIAELRRFVPLEALGQELEAHLATLKGKLVEVINEDYNDFVSLTTKLVNVDGVLLRMTGPLQEVGKRLDDVHAGLQAELDALNQGLQARQETAAARALLELMRDAAHTMTKVESLLDEIESEEEGDGSASSEALDGRCQMLERLASEVSRLNFYAAKGKDLAFVQSLEGRMEAAREKLRFRLSAALKAALVGSQAAARQHCLLAYAAVQDPTGAEQVVREALLRPLIARVLEQHSAAAPRPAEAFPQVLQEILKDALPLLAPLLELSGGGEAGGAHGFDFLGGSLLAEVDAAVTQHLAGAISPGAPAAFLTSYRAALAFLEGLEGACPSRAALQTLRGSAATAGFLRRWKLSIYFSTRFQEIAGGLEEAAAASQQLPAAGEEQPLNPKPEGLQAQLAATRALATALERVMSPDVFLRPLADKFARLAFQLLARYASWLAAGATGEQAATKQESGWGGGEQSLELLLAARADVDSLLPWLRTSFGPAFAAATGFLPQQTRSALAEALEAGIAGIARQAGPVAEAAVARLAERCCSALSQLRGITAMYRMSARPAPTRPSHYVSGILASLAQALDLPPAKPLSPAARQQISEAVVAAVADRFRRMAEELLDTLRRTESSLKRIRQSRAPEAGGGAGGPSDVEKISLQLFLDVQEFGRQAGKFGVVASALPAYQSLWRAVAPPGEADSIKL